ncbi:MAG: oxygenase MpaB family protein [Aeromicrobium sp.]
MNPLFVGPEPEISPARANDAAGSPAPTPAVALADIIAEPVLLLGAGSTVLYQLAMKGVGQGVAEHSTTLARPVDRLRTTLTFVYAMILGTDEERQSIARMVNRAHAPVRSAGRYTAFDPDLQLWVAATLAQNGIDMYERVFGSLDDASRQRLYEDSQIFGTILQVEPGAWPATYAEFLDYWAEALDRTEPDAAVRVYVQRLLDPNNGSVGARALVRMQGLMSRGNLDPRIREVLCLTWTPTDQRAYDLFWTVFPPLYRLVPKALRQLPTRLVLADMRRRMRGGKRVI